MQNTNLQSNWQRMSFEDFADTSPSVKLERGKEYPFIPMENVDGQSKFPVKIKCKKFTGSGSKFANGDTIFARITPCLENGKIAKVKDLTEGVGFGSTEFFVFRNRDGMSDSNFVYYLSRTSVIRDPAVKSMVGASGRQRADKEAIDNVQVMVPALLQQKQIADVLSAYDDLIENNSRRIQILEQMAQEIYKEWFVNFRFPGHEKVKMIDSGTDFGKIPEGWKIAKLPEVFDFLEGPGIRNWQYTPTGCPFINIRLIKNNDINISSASFISKEEADGKYNHFHLQEKDMVVSTSGTLGRSAIVRKEHLPLLLNTSVIRFRPNDGRSYAFMYQFLNADYFQNKILSMASGSAQPNFGPIHLKQIDVLVPSERVLDSFGDLVNLIYDGIAVYLSENQRLRQTRDLLLPKLVTGEVEVK